MPAGSSDDARSIARLRVEDRAHTLDALCVARTRVARRAAGAVRKWSTARRHGGIVASALRAKVFRSAAGLSCPSFHVADASALPRAEEGRLTLACPRARLSLPERRLAQFSEAPEPRFAEHAELGVACFAERGAAGAQAFARASRGTREVTHALARIAFAPFGEGVGSLAQQPVVAFVVNAAGARLT